jgi:pimeloyl-ACP methyl ester carboxylesterase
MLIAPGFVSHLEWWRSAPRNQAFLRLLSEHRTVVVYDRHGCGLSDRDRSDFSPEDDIMDIEAVAGAVAGCEPLDLLGDSWGARPTVYFAARHPERVRRMVIYGAAAPGRVSEMFLERRAAMAALRRTDLDLFARSTAMTLFPDGLDHETLQIIVPLLRTAATPEMQEHLEEVFFDLDSILGEIETPTLVVHRQGDQAAPFAHGQRLASQIPNARFLPLDGNTHPMWAGDYESVATAILDFLLAGVDSPRDARADPPREYVRYSFE